MNARTFSQIHIQKPPPIDESKRLRGRAGQFFRTVSSNSAYKAALFLSTRVGLPIKSTTLPEYLLTAPLSDFLDSITHIFNGLPHIDGEYDRKNPKREWLHFIKEAFEEENVAYRVLDDGSVTYLVDKIFAENNDAAIGALSLSSYGHARKHFDDAHRYLSKPGSEVAAIRSMFDAVENVFKILSGNSRLGSTEFTKHFAASSGSQSPERDAHKLMLKSASEWINACHNYRHADDNVDPTAPSRMLTIMMLGTGTNILRWMIAMGDQSG